MDAFVGIDVAFAKGKRLPVSVCTREGGRLSPLRLRCEGPPPPRGEGNRKALDAHVRRMFARSVRLWLVHVQELHGLRLRRIAIDAPRMPCPSGRERRKAEEALRQAGIFCIQTPDREAFDTYGRHAVKHLRNGSPVSRLPGANLWWMRVGFDLYRELESLAECIEVYPQATVQVMGCAKAHKSTKKGYQAQLEATAKALRYGASELEAAIGKMGFGSRHDKLDALLSAWVASLPKNRRWAFGEPPDDVIWVPCL